MFQRKNVVCWCVFFLTKKDTFVGKNKIFLRLKQQSNNRFYTKEGQGMEARE